MSAGSNKAKLLLLGFACFAVSSTEFVIVGLLDVIAASVGVSVSAAGQLVTAYALGAGIGAPAAMMVFSKLDRRYIMMIALALVAVGSVIMALGLGFVPLLIARVVMAVGSGTFTVCCFSAATTFAQPGREGGAIAVISTSFSAALVLGLPLGRALLAFFDWTVVFWAAAVIALAAIGIVWRIIERGSEEAPMPLGQQLRLLTNPLFLLTFAISLFWLGGYSLLYSYISPFLLSLVPLDDSTLSVALLLFGILTLVGNSVGGVLGDKLGVRRTIFGSLLVQVIALAALALSGGNLVVAVVSLVLWGLSCWGPAAPQQLNVISLAPQASGVMLSLHNTVIQVAYAMGAAVGGATMEAAGMGSLAWIAVAFVVLSAATTFASARMARRQGSVPEQEPEQGKVHAQQVVLTSE